MTKFIRSMIAAVALLAAMPVVTWADGDVPDSRFVNFVLSAGLTYGGDRIIGYRDVPGQANNGGVQAGGVFEIGGGLLLKPKHLPIALQLTENYQVDTVTGEEGTATLTRLPVELIGFYTGVENWRFGLGARYLRDAHMTVRYNNADYRDDFKSTFSPVIQAGYSLSDDFWVDLRWVHEDLTTLDTSTWHAEGRRFNANHAGIFVSGVF